MEWYIMLMSQSLCISFLLISCLAQCVALADTPHSTLMVHRRFCVGYVFTLMSTSCWLYLPMSWRLVFVSIQSCIIWISFHWMVGFCKPVPIILGFILPGMEILHGRTVEKKSWNLFYLAEQETKARVLSEELMTCLRGVLNMTFDASCECDETGRILHSSQHLQQLLGCSSCDPFDFHLAQLTADDLEAQRVNNFLWQIRMQRQGSARHDFGLPAVLETVLKCSASQVDRMDQELKVKLCCVALPLGGKVSNFTFEAENDEIQ